MEPIAIMSRALQNSTEPYTTAAEVDYLIHLMENVMTMTKPFKSKTFLLVSLIIHLQSTCCTEMPSDDCGLKTCPEGQICVEASADSKSSCACAQGYQGSACDQDINECSAGSSPCKHGLCINTLGSYMCKCPLGYMGSHCELELNRCKSNPCKNNASCYNMTGGYHCVCKSGWTGKDCSENIDDCVTAACAHGSTCHDRVASYICECPPGRTGLLCHIIDSCITNPCPQSSHCLTNPINGEAVCNCHAGYVGPHCNIDVDECDHHNPCEHGGRCINTVGSFSCQCPVGYTRSRCELDINECLSNPCPNGATCLDQIGKYTCVCHPGQNCTEKDCFAWCKNGGQCVRTETGSHCECAKGWTGEDCSENIDDCATAACFGGSTCHDRVASFYCECPPGLTGLLCHLDDACITNPCPQGSTCDTNPINGRAICTCPAGYVGPHCSVDIDECKFSDHNTCKHGGCCINTVGSFSCQCPVGYTRSRCELDINECLSNPCPNGATCIDQIGKYTCVCHPGLSGNLCEVQRRQ